MLSATHDRVEGSIAPASANKAFRHRFGMSPTQFRLASVSSQSSSAT